MRLLAWLGWDAEWVGGVMCVFVLWFGLWAPWAWAHAVMPKHVCSGVLCPK